jgi:hypothetical protein
MLILKQNLEVRVHVIIIINLWTLKHKSYEKYYNSIVNNLHTKSN